MSRDPSTPRRRGRGWRRAARLLLVLALGVGLAGLWYLDQRILNLGVAWGPDLTPIPQTAGSPLGVNLFLEREPDPAKVDQSLQLAAAGGFQWIRQSFPWYDIEIAGKGDFMDRRGPGLPHSAWDKYDAIVAAAGRRGLQIMARLDTTPLWAHPGVINAVGYHKGPPLRDADFADFAGAVAARYRGRIATYQIWNEPNLAVEWAGPADARAYTALLQAGYRAIKAADPAAVVVLGGLAPTVGSGAGGDANDLQYLQALYDAGARPYFDIASIMIYGLGYAPAERRVDQRPGDLARVNFSRPLLTRALMERNGDGAKPIWASEYGWVSLPPDWPGKPSSWGASVDEATQAQYLVDGYRRARAEWPWMGVMFVWHLRDPDPLPREPQPYFAILRPDFSPRPAYTALQAYARRFPIADTGAHLLPDPAAPVTTGTTTIKFQGTRLDLVYLPAAAPIPLHVQWAGPAPADTAGAAASSILPAGRAPLSDELAPAPGWPAPAGAALRRLLLAHNLADGPHEVTLSGADALAAVRGFVVSREPALPWAFPAAYALLTAALAASLVWAVWPR
ncbi:MAG TPA: cellulase family glycosylhydrolase [Chloroflexia bacterium]|nr:cellulase family glycosylhydrolase [Chloroflexia bacterium]